MNKGIYIWNLSVDGKEYTTPEKLAQELKAGGFGHALIKVCDGTSKFNILRSGVDLVPLYKKALEDAGIAVWGWGYVYGSYPAGEAAVAIERIRELGLDFFTVDAESEYKGRRSQAVTYMNTLQKEVGTTIFALSSFRFPTYHPEFPWREFLDRVDMVMPQVYWEGATNAGEQLRRCVKEYKEKTLLPIAVTGAAYKSTSVTWQPTASQVEEFYETAKELNIDTVNYWEWQCAKTIGLWQTLMALEGTEPEDTNPDYYNDDKIRAIVRDEVEKILSEATATILTDSIKMLVRYEIGLVLGKVADAIRGANG